MVYSSYIEKFELLFFFYKTVGTVEIRLTRLIVVVICIRIIENPEFIKKRMFCIRVYSKLCYPTLLKTLEDIAAKRAS